MTATISAGHFLLSPVTVRFYFATSLQMHVCLCSSSENVSLLLASAFTLPVLWSFFFFLWLQGLHFVFAYNLTCDVWSCHSSTKEGVRIIIFFFLWSPMLLVKMILACALLLLSRLDFFFFFCSWEFQVYFFFFFPPSWVPHTSVAGSSHETSRNHYFLCLVRHLSLIKCYVS